MVRRVKYRVGCTGWGYDDWRGGFYPPGTPAREYLERYSRVFDLVEVDSSYYRIPRREDVARWAVVTPAGFMFTPKFPSDITHKARLRDAGELLDRYLSALGPLRRTEKLGPLVMQMPASFTRDKDAAALEAFVNLIPREYRLAVELRHKSWWNADTRRVLEDRGAALVWSVNQYAETPPEVTADFVYARFIGDRAITKFDTIQRDLTEEMRVWKKRFENEGKSAHEVLVLLNNHFMGFAPVTAVRMQMILGLEPADITKAARDTGQRGLGDFA